MSPDSNKKDKKNLWKALQKPYKLAFINQETFREERVFALTPWRLIWFGATAIAFVFLIFLIVFRFTPLGRWTGLRQAPGAGIMVGEGNARTSLEALYLQVDSLAMQVSVRDEYIANLQTALLGKKVEGNNGDSALASDPLESTDTSAAALAAMAVEVPEKDSATERLIATARNELEIHSLITETFLEGARVQDFRMVAPLTGVVSLSDTFAPDRGHYGLDIIAPSGSSIKAVRSGTVVVATWSADTGYMIAVQHDNNLISFYKHNSKLLKKTGDLVKTGEAVAIIGNTGEMTSGPHLHFELWFGGQPVNPQRYLLLETN